jgi:hypothetical protein
MGNACVLCGGFSMQNPFPFYLNLTETTCSKNAFAARASGTGGCATARV